MRPACAHLPTTVKVFVDGYNKGNTITDVLVEYEGQYEPNRVKVNPKDGLTTPGFKIQKSIAYVEKTAG